MIGNGYIRVYRSLTKKGYYKNSKYVHLWVYLLMKASYQETEYLFNNEIKHLQPGQFIVGRKVIAKETGIRETTIERILSCFESEQQIGQQKNNKFRIITILNWSEYQTDGQQNGQQMDSQRTASGQPADTINNKKKLNKEKKISPPFVLPDWIPPELWSAYLDVRIKKRAAKTDNALWLIIQELEKIKQIHNHDPVEVLKKSVRSGWTDVYPLKDGGNDSGRRTPDSARGPGIQQRECVPIPEWKGTEQPSTEATADGLKSIGQILDTLGTH